jgi:hypothetical protein
MHGVFSGVVGTSPPADDPHLDAEGGALPVVVG